MILSGLIGGMPLPEVVGDDIKNLNKVSKAAQALTTGDFGTGSAAPSFTI